MQYSDYGITAQSRQGYGAQVLWRLARWNGVAGFSGVAGLVGEKENFCYTVEHDDPDRPYALPYLLRSGEEQVLSRWNMLEQKMTVSREQAVVECSIDGILTLVSKGKGPTLWRAYGADWVALHKGERLVLTDGDQVGLDCNDPEAAVFMAQQEGAYSQQQQQQGGYTQGQPLYVQASYDFPNPEPGQLGFRAGDVIVVTQQGNPDDWWEGSLNGQVGWFPSTFCSAPWS